MRGLFAAGALLAAGCSVAGERPMDEVSLMGSTLQLVEREGKCVLIHGSSESVLSPEPPCFFLRKPAGGGPQFYAYDDVGVDAVLIAAGTQVPAEKRDLWTLPEGAVCGWHGQGVLIREGQVSLTVETLEGGLFCRDYGVDEKNYWHFAHERAR